MKSIMTKTFSVLSLFLLLALLLCGCNSDRVGADSTDTDAKTEDSDTVANAFTADTARALAYTVANTCSFSETLVENDAYLANHLFGFGELVRDASFYTAYVPSAITPEEVFVFLCGDDISAGALKTKLLEYVEYQTSEYGDYAPNEVPKLNDAVIIQKDCVVVYVVSLDNAAANDTVNRLLK